MHVAEEIMRTKLETYFPDARAETARSDFALPIVLKQFKPLTIGACAATGDGARAVKPFRL